MTQGNITSINWNGNNFFSGYVAENNIYTYNGELIGVNLAKYQETERGLQKCRDKLVELGVIVPEKKPEEIIKEQSELLQKQTEMCNTLIAKLEQLGGLNGLTGTQGDNTVVTNATDNKRESIASIQQSNTDNKPPSELHNGRSKKNSATK